jgi:hypothetical protein
LVGPPRAVSCARRALQTPSAGRGKPPRQLTALGWPWWQVPLARLTPDLNPRLCSAAAPGSADSADAPAPRRHGSVVRQAMFASAARTPGRRITATSSGNARKLAGLRCVAVMRQPPMPVCHLAARLRAGLPIAPTVASAARTPSRRSPRTPPCRRGGRTARPRVPTERCGGRLRPIRFGYDAR